MISSRNAFSSLVFLLTFLALSHAARTQQLKQHKPARVPVYRSANDSIRIIVIDQEIEQAYQKTSTPQHILDTLTAKRDRAVKEGVVRYKNVYYASDEMTPLDSLVLISDRNAVKAVSIDRKRLKRLPKILRSFPNLETIELVNCQISKIDRSIKRLHYLHTLIILNNGAQHPLRLAKSKSITTLTVHGENPASNPTEFKRLPHLKSLILSDCQLNAFPNGIFDNKKLEELDLQHNNITLENDELKPLPSLKRLALQYNQIRKVPASIQSFQGLQRLNLNHNKIVEVAPEIASLKNLEYASFYNNQLSSIPRGMFALRSLKLVDLYFNQLAEIPNEIAQWRDLEILFVAHNKIWTLPDTLLSLPKLTEIYAYDNLLVQLPERIDRLTGLRILRVNQNLIKEIPPALTNLTEIEELDFSDNYISHLPPGILDFVKLKVATFVSNPLNDASLQLLNLKLKEFKGRDIVLQFSKEHVAVP